MRRLTVNISNNNYDICISNNILANAHGLIREVYAGAKIAIITDTNVYPLYAKELNANLKLNGFESEIIVVSSGEKSKSIENLEFIYTHLIEQKINRKSLIIAMGGGVVGDLAGFAASTFLRGVPFIQIPTTLLSQVDSSVGGKVAVNLKQGKNMVGAFYQPKMVIIDTEYLKTLDRRFLSDGMAEVIKHALIYDSNLFGKLNNLNDLDELFDIIEYVVYRNCKIKATIVEVDEKETKERMTLNFGHSYGHTIETYFKYEKYTHGEAVGLGMLMEAELGQRLGVTPKGTVEAIERILKKYNLPTTVDMDKKDIFELMKIDKKLEDDGINIILLNEIGRCSIHKLKIQDISDIYTD